MFFIEISFNLKRYLLFVNKNNKGVDFFLIEEAMNA